MDNNITQMGTAYGCPYCKSTSGFTEHSIIEAKSEIGRFSDSGKPVYEDYTVMDLSARKANPAQSEPYTCHACGRSFSAPLRFTVKR
jgi:transposase-like protein